MSVKCRDKQVVSVPRDSRRHPAPPPHPGPPRRATAPPPIRTRWQTSCHADAPASVLSDGTILELVEEGRIRIDPWDPGLVQPASVDLRLGDSFRVFHNHRASAIDLRSLRRKPDRGGRVPHDDSFVIHPGEFCLGRTLEWVELPDDIVARIEGKSSLAASASSSTPPPASATPAGRAR